jgi:hypothetical protein
LIAIMQYFAITHVEFNQAMIGEHKYGLIKFIFPALDVISAKLMLRFNDRRKFFPECPVSFFSINPTDKMDTGQQIETIEIERFALQKTPAKYIRGIDGFLCIHFVHKNILKPGRQAAWLFNSWMTDGKTRLPGRIP